MPDNQDVIRIVELSKLDTHELKQEFGGKLQLETEELAADKAGEPVTFIATVALTALAIKGISLWLLKRRTKGEVEFAFEHRRGDGSTEKRTARIVFSSSSPPPTSVVEQVGAALRADEALIREAKSLVSG